MTLAIILILIAVALNYDCKKDLLLTLLVGLTVLLPMQLLKEYYYLWYAVCIGSELLKVVVAANLRTKISFPVMFLSTLMAVCHITSMYFGGFSFPYKTIMPILEHFELLVCILFSAPILTILIKEFKCRLKQ